MRRLEPVNLGLNELTKQNLYALYQDPATLSSIAQNEQAGYFKVYYLSDHESKAISHGDAVKLLSGQSSSKIRIWATHKPKKQTEITRRLSQRGSWRRGVPPHAVQGPGKEGLVQLVLVSQDGALLERHRHRRPVFGTFTTGETNAVEFATNL